VLGLADPESFADALLSELPPRPAGQEKIVAANRTGAAEAAA
jgi:hypothetical protein